MGKSEEKREEEPEEKVEKRFFETLPGILTAIATLITAIAGCIAILLSPQILDRLFPQATPAPTIVQIFVTSPPSLTSPVATETVAVPTAIAPRIYGFEACPTACNGQNNTNNFASGVTKLYVQFNYENFTAGMPYTRTWSMSGNEWIRYTCAWDGPSSGTEILKLTEPEGLKSGVWEMTVTANDAVILKEQITVIGNWNYWSPAGVINACHSTN